MLDLCSLQVFFRGNHKCLEFLATGVGRAGGYGVHMCDGEREGWCGMRWDGTMRVRMCAGEREGLVLLDETGRESGERRGAKVRGRDCGTGASEETGRACCDLSGRGGCVPGARVRWIEGRVGVHDEPYVATRVGGPKSTGRVCEGGRSNE